MQGMTTTTAGRAGAAHAVRRNKEQSWDLHTEVHSEICTTYARSCGRETPANVTCWRFSPVLVTREAIHQHLGYEHIGEYYCHPKGSRRAQPAEETARRRRRWARRVDVVVHGLRANAPPADEADCRRAAGRFGARGRAPFTIFATGGAFSRWRSDCPRLFKLPERPGHRTEMPIR